MSVFEIDEPFYDEAVKFVVETQRVSVSSIQRKFRIGYNRAARIIEKLEIAGIISCPEQSGARVVFAK